MKTTLYTILFRLSLLLSLAFSSLVYSQITISSEDLLGQIGSTQVLQGDQRFNIPINVGSPGENQTWDFRNQNIEDTIISVSEFLNPDVTGSANTFPNANLVQKITDPDQPGFEIFNFYNIISDFFINLGDSSRIISMDFDTSFVNFQNDTTSPLPIAYGNMWITTERDTTGFFPQAATISIDTTYNEIDGWGTVKLPMGDFECLRNKQIVQVINQTIFNGMIFSVTVDSFVQYNWIAKGVFQVAIAQSRNGDTDPNFTIAQGFSRLDSLKMGPTDVAHKTEFPTEFVLFQNYPNPFNPVTTIEYSVPKTSDISLVVYDALGREIKTLVNEVETPGNYTVQFDGTDLSSGVYFYVMKSYNFIETKKLILLK